MVSSKFFSEGEFKRCTPSCSLQDMKQDFMFRLDAARQMAGIPFVITSAYRPVSWELSKGRTGTSSHTKGLAIDIRCNTDYNRSKIIKALLDVGFTRIGVAKTYIHVDLDKEKNQNRIWVYD